MIPNRPRLEAAGDPLRRDDLLAHWKATRAAAHVGPPTLRREVTLEVGGGGVGGAGGSTSTKYPRLNLSDLPPQVF